MAFRTLAYVLDPIHGEPAITDLAWQFPKPQWNPQTRKTEVSQFLYQLEVTAWELAIVAKQIEGLTACKQRTDQTDERS